MIGKILITKEFVNYLKVTEKTIYRLVANKAALPECVIKLFAAFLKGTLREVHNDK